MLKNLLVLVMSNFIFANCPFCIHMFSKSTGAISFKLAPLNFQTLLCALILVIKR